MILSLQGCMAVGKTTAVCYLQKNAPYINISYEVNSDIVEEVKRRKLDKNVYEDYLEIVNKLYNSYFSRIHRLLAGESDADYEKRFKENIEKYKATHNGEEPDVFDIADETKDGTGIMNWWC